MERDFHADAPNALWVTDVTQFTMDGYKCWLSPVVDCFDGMVVSWTLSRSPNADMANRMLLDAVATLRDGEHPIIHSDRGCHYRWDEWIRICEEHGLIRSMSVKGCSPDNAAAEGFFGRLKNEFFYGRDWSGVGYEEFRERLSAYLTHYNETRIKKSLDWMSPVQISKHLDWPPDRPKNIRTLLSVSGYCSKKPKIKLCKCYGCNQCGRLWALDRNAER